MTTTTNPIEVLMRKATLKARKASILPDMGRVATIILAGGEGKRLFPLTQKCCKPAINFGGRYRLIDVPISNAINSDCQKIFVVTQFLSTSLHRHIMRGYSHYGFDVKGIEILSPEQKPGKSTWFEGTADAVRQNIDHLLEASADYFLILSGDQLYTIDFRKMLQVALTTKVDLVVASLPISETDCKRMGVLKTDDNGIITDFLEKPKDRSHLSGMEISSILKAKLLRNGNSNNYLGSMGIYLFKKEALLSLLEEDKREDFGMHLLPTIIAKGNTATYLFDGYWEDIGTIESFYQANMGLTAALPAFNCYDETRPIFTSHSHLAAPKISASRIDHSIICEGSIINGCEINGSIIGPRTVLRPGCRIENSYLMGNDYYQRPTATEALPELLQVGKDCIISKTIVDKNVRIGDGVQLINKKKLSHYDGEGIYIRDGIIVVPNGASIPDGFIL